MTATMIEMVYGVEAALIMNETLCDVYLQKGACPRLLLGEIGVSGVIQRVGGSGREVGAFFDQLLKADLPEEELEAALRDGEFNGMILPESGERLERGFDAERLPNVSLLEVFRNAGFVDNPPKITVPAMLEEMCLYDVAIISAVISLVQTFPTSIEKVSNATVLADLVPYPGWTQNAKCDHALYLKSNTGNDSGCNLGPNGDIFEFFTWGQSRFASLDMLMNANDGVICSAVVANVE